MRLALFLLGAAFVFGLLLLASFWFAIPFGLALIALGVALLEIAQRARVGLHVVRSWRVR